MRTLATLAIVIAAAVLAFFLWTDRGVSDAVVDAGSPTVVPEADDPPPAEIVPVAAEDETARTAVPEAAAEPASVNEGAAPVCAIHGIVVDQDQRPLAGALVQLAQYPEWNAEGDGETLARFGASRWAGMVGFEARTGADGRFRLEVAEPSGERQTLYIAADRHHDSFTLRFGGTRGETRPTLSAGDHDLGTIVLAAAGAIHGRVTDASGAPIEGVRMGIGPSKGTTYGRYATTAADGSYVIQHAPAGTYGVDTDLDGWVDQFREPVTVEVGQDTGPIDFAIERAPTITGRVVDANGAPIEGVRLWGWPSSSGSGAGSRSEADGSFTIPLPQTEPYSLEATHADYVKWGDASDKSTMYEPGRTGIEIVMTPAAKTRFLVVDDASGEPIEQFGFNVLEENGSKAKRRSHTERRRPRPKDRPGGAVVRSGRVGVDLYVVYAEGYLLATGDIEHDEEGVLEQTIRLKRGARLVGRVMHEGRAVEGADVEVVKSRGNRVDENTLQRTKSDAEGRFALVGLSGRNYRLTVSATAGAPVVRHGLGCTPPEDTDVGDVEIVPGGTIRGSVSVAAGIDPSGLTVRRGAWEDGLTVTTDASGRFRFDDVSVGEHRLSQDGRPGVLDSGGGTTVTVASGETVDVTLDLVRLTLVQVSLTIDLGDLPARDVHVELVAIDAPKYSKIDRRGETRIDLDETNEDGVATGSGRALGPTVVRIWIPSVGTIEHPTARIDVAPGRAIEETVAFELASLAIDGVGDLPLPEDGTLTVELERPGERSFGSAARVPIKGGALAPTNDAFIALEGDTLVVRGLGPGDVAVSVFATATDAPDVETPLGNGRISFSKKRDFERSALVTLVADETTRIDVR